MNILSAKIENGALKKHYQKGMQRLLELPSKDNELLAYLSTLGGGLVDKDEYNQDFDINSSKVVLNSQSSQKIYKGKTKLNTKINLNKSSVLVFYNLANIFYKDADFLSKIRINLSKCSKLLYLDGGFLGYSKGEFKAKMNTTIFSDYNLALSDVFSYKQNINAFYDYEYFYTMILYGFDDIKHLDTKNIKAYYTDIKGFKIIRVLADDNDLAMNYLDNIKKDFLNKFDMSLLI